MTAAGGVAPGPSRAAVLWSLGGRPHAPPVLLVDAGAPAEPPHRFRDLQSAVNQALRDGGQAPRLIRIAPGVYPGPVLIPPEAPPLILDGAGARAVTLTAGLDAGMTGREFLSLCAPLLPDAPSPVRAALLAIGARQRLGTGNTAVLRIARDDTRVSGLTIRNDYACDRAASAPLGEEPDTQGRYAHGQHQAVALHVAGADRVHLSAVHLSSYQDTLYLEAPPGTAGGRVLIEDSTIEGDVDFIFGGATAWLERCRIISRGARGARSWALAPSTSLHRRFGFVLRDCDFTHDGAEAGRAGRSFLGRQWFEGVRATPYGQPDQPGYRCRASDVSRYDPPDGQISTATLQAVGKAHLTGCRIGPHISAARPWDSWGGAGWSPRFRPVQRRAGDFLSLLGPWLTDQGLDYTALNPEERWLELQDCRFLHP